MTARLVVTLPAGLRGEECAAFAADVRRRGAHLLEVRDDLSDPSVIDGERLAAQLPLLLAHRGGRGFPSAWPAALVDHPLGSAHGAPLLSWHATEPVAPAEALRRWEEEAPAPGTHLKHVEPMGPDPSSWLRLLETQRHLRARFGDRVTVLATGPWALPLRAVLSADNALEYVAASPATASAPGQRLLDDAVRSAGAAGPRFALVGHAIPHARSPRIHPPPFDRWDLPPDAPVGALLDAFRGHYAGFAVTSPFKGLLARHVGSALPAINTLVRTGSGWNAYNTDVDGARVALRRAGVKQLAVLGDGGVTSALRLAGADVRVMRAGELEGRHLHGDVAWTWPPHVEPPRGLSLRDARVLVIAYGRPARVVASRIRALGGEPVHVGAAWFIAQARAQRELWRSAA